MATSASRLLPLPLPAKVAQPLHQPVVGQFEISAKDQLRQQLMDEPPEVTKDNVFATLQQFVSDAGTIVRRGIATAFSALDRRFRSYDG